LQKFPQRFRAAGGSANRNNFFGAHIRSHASMCQRTKGQHDIGGVSRPNRE
jgi:hypothetical protein